MIQNEAVLTKDGRELPMFLARGPASELLDGPLTNGIPAAFAARYEAEFGEKTRSFRAATIRLEDTGYSSMLHQPRG